MTETTLVKLGYSKIDKLCDATFIRSIFKSTKKDFALFVSENEDLQSFFESIEEKIDETNVEYQGMIREYVESISDDVNAFKLKIKEVERKKKLDEKERQKELLKQEILKEMEDEKRKAELEAKLGIKPNSGNNKANKEYEEEETDSSGKPELKFKSKLKLKDIEPKDNKNDSNNSNNLPKSFDQGSMDLGLFYAFLQQVVKNDLLIIKSDSGRMTIKDLDLDDDKIRIKVVQS